MSTTRMNTPNITTVAVSIYTSIEGTSRLLFVMAPEDETNVLQTFAAARA
jgi:hypothetical protein